MAKVRKVNTPEVTPSNKSFAVRSFRLSDEANKRIAEIREKFNFANDRDALEFIIAAFTANDNPSALTDEHIDKVFAHIFPRVVANLREQLSTLENIAETIKPATMNERETEE